MEEARTVNRIETNFSHEKIDFLNADYAEEVDYWKRAALGCKNKEERKQLTNMASSKVFLTRKDAGKSSAKNIHEMLFYLKKNYSSHNEEQARIDDTPQDDSFSFEEMSNYLKSYSKPVIEVENMTLKNKILFGGWLSTSAKVFRSNKMRGKFLPNRFEDWILRECGIKKQTIYNYKNFYRLMIIAPKLLNCQVNMTYFVKNHDILLNYFQEIEDTV